MCKLLALECKNMWLQKFFERQLTNNKPHWINPESSIAVVLIEPSGFFWCKINKVKENERLVGGIGGGAEGSASVHVLEKIARTFIPVCKQGR